MSRADDRIYRKTALGVAALATRTGALTSRARMALILVNGHDSFALLAGKLGADTSELVAMLFDRGLVEEVVAAPVPAPPAPVPVPVPPPAQSIPTDERLASLKRTAIARLTPQDRKSVV